MAVLARTLGLSLLVLLCLAHTTLSLAIPAHGRLSQPVPSSPTSDVSATALEARNLAGEKTLVQRATESLGGNGGSHDFLVKGLYPLSRGAVKIKRDIWDLPFRYVSFDSKDPKGKDPKGTDPKGANPKSINPKGKDPKTTGTVHPLVKPHKTTGTVHPLLRPHGTPINYDSLREIVALEQKHPTLRAGGILKLLAIAHSHTQVLQVRPLQCGPKDCYTVTPNH